MAVFTTAPGGLLHILSEILGKELTLGGGTLREKSLETQLIERTSSRKWKSIKKQNTHTKDGRVSPKPQKFTVAYGSTTKV